MENFTWQLGLLCEIKPTHPGVLKWLWEEVNIPSWSLCYAKTVLPCKAQIVLCRSIWNGNSLIKLFIVYGVCWFILHRRGTWALFRLGCFETIQWRKPGLWEMALPMKGWNGRRLNRTILGFSGNPSVPRGKHAFSTKIQFDGRKQVLERASFSVSEPLLEPLQVWRAVPGPCFYIENIF